MYLSKSTKKLGTSKKVLAFLSLISLCACTEGPGIDKEINDSFMPFAKTWEAIVFTPVTIGNHSLPLVLILLISGALFFTLYFGFVNIRYFSLALQIVRGKYDQLEHAINPGKKNGEVNHFQALSTAISGTVGLGNISMVAVAITIGGPGATFWMILAGLLGMSSKFVECTLGVKYRFITASGQVAGGPMYYLSKGFAENGQAVIGKMLAILFAVFCIGASLGGGNALQSNQAAAQIIGRFSLEGSASGTIIGIIFALLVGIVIIGGIQRIAKVTEKIVPLMAGLYLLSTFIILLLRWDVIDDALFLIFKEAFSPQATIAGGFAAVMMQGFRRAVLSNEAGVGSSAIVHSAVDTQYPASEGLVGLLEPFIDTVIICTMTALVIVIFNMEGAFIYGDVINNQATLLETGQKVGGVTLTSMAFDNALPGFSYVLSIAVVLFAFSTILAWSYYGLQAWKYIFGYSKRAELLYKIIFLSFTIMGSAITFDAVLKFSDAMMLALVFPNMIGLFFLFPKVKDELKTFLTAIKKQEKVESNKEDVLKAA